MALGPYCPFRTRLSVPILGPVVRSVAASLPDDLPPIEDLIGAPPTSWLGRPVEWLTPPVTEPVFLRTFDIPRPDRMTDRILLFGARYPLADAIVDGESYGDGFFVEYFVAEDFAGNWVIHRLLQRGSVAYTEGDESREHPQYVPAREVGDPTAFALNAAPQWKASEASWPTYEGTPMQFIGQMALTKTEVTSNFFTWGDSFYLFYAESEHARAYKIFEQETHGQTAEEHYELEEQLSRDD